MKDRSEVRSKILSATSYELRLLLRGILLPISLVTFFAYIIISIIDVERTGFFNGIPSSIILVIGTVIIIKLLVHTKLEKMEIRRFRFIFLSLIGWLIGELIYVYYQAFLGIAVPYPSIADIFYLSATVFLSFHLYNILRLRKGILKNRLYLYLGLLAPIFPIYLLADTIYNYEEYYPSSITEFVVNASYYISDAIVIFPCIPIILGLRKNDPFIFHWLLIAISVFILVAGDLGYTFVATVNDELLTNTEWFWSFIFAIGYLLLTVSILWFSKIKEILEYKKHFEVIKNEQINEIDISNEAKEFEFAESSNQMIERMTKASEKAEKYIDILFAQYIIEEKDIVKFVDTLDKWTKRNKKLNIRILLPSPKFTEAIPSSNHPNLSIKYFDRHLDANTVTSILDNELIYIVGYISENPNSRLGYFIQNLNSEPKLLASIALFERIWLLEESVDFG